jgi:hypothetical protein
MDFGEKEEGIKSESQKTYYQILRNNKKTHIYNLIEESLNKDLKKVSSKNVPSRKCIPKKSGKYSHVRNTVKKVKIFCLKFFKLLLKDCIEPDKKQKVKFKSNDEQKILMFNTFKCDISKCRNKLLLNQPMKIIIETFSNFNCEILEEIKPEKKPFFYFLINSKWKDLVNYIKMETTEIFEFFYPKKILNWLSLDEINEYLKYIESGPYILKKRINEDVNYLNLYERFVYPDNKKNISFSNDDKHFQDQFIEFLENPII